MLLDVFHDGRIVGNGLGVRCTTNACEATRDRGPTFVHDGRFVLVARFAQVGTEFYETGTDHLAAYIDCLCRGKSRRRTADAQDPTFSNIQIRGLIRIRCRIDYSTAT